MAQVVVIDDEPELHGWDQWRLWDSDGLASGLMDWLSHSHDDRRRIVLLHAGHAELRRRDALGNSVINLPALAEVVEQILESDRWLMLFTGGDESDLVDALSRPDRIFGRRLVIVGAFHAARILRAETPPILPSSDWRIESLLLSHQSVEPTIDALLSRLRTLCGIYLALHQTENHMLVAGVPDLSKLVIAGCPYGKGTCIDEDKGAWDERRAHVKAAGWWRSGLLDPEGLLSTIRSRPDLPDDIRTSADRLVTSVIEGRVVTVDVVKAFFLCPVSHIRPFRSE